MDNVDDSTREKLSLLSVTPKADHDPNAAASSQSPPRPPSTLPLEPFHNAMVHLSPAEVGCDAQTVDTSMPPSDTCSKSLTPSDNSPGGEAVATQDLLTAHIDDRHNAPSRFQLSRSRTISVADNGESLLLDPTCRLDLSSDEGDLPDEAFLSEDKSEGAESRAEPLLTPQILTWLATDDDQDVDAKSLNLFPELSPGEEEAVNRQEIEEDSPILVDPPHACDQSCDERNLDIVMQTKPQNGSSVITDAGDQQFKRQKRAGDREGVVSQELGGSQPSSPTVTSPAEYPSEHELNCQLFAALQLTRDRRGKGFLPKAQLYSLVNPESVAQELRNSLSQTQSNQQIRECAESVCAETEVVLSNGRSVIKSFRKIFALLVLVEKSSSIHLFLQEDVSDLDLPLITVRTRGLIELRRKTASGEPSSEPLACFSKWSPVRRKEFEEYQWTMLAPFFSKSEYNNVAHYVLRDEHILPFIDTPNWEEENTEYQGGFGMVFMVRIHHEHHNFSTPKYCDRGFAIKQLFQNDRPSFKREVDILKKFSGERSHPHIVSLLATYEQFNKFHLIFHRAEGNLFKYWGEINPSPQLDYSNIIWMAKQCAGIARGLLMLHKHHTIKPANSIPNYDEEKEFKLRSTGEIGEISERIVRIIDPVLQKDQNSLRRPNSDRQFESPTLAFRPVISRFSSEPQGRRQRRPIDGRPARWVNEPWSSSGDLVRQWGRHGDLKPENILWYHDPEEEKGTLKISDFGEAELNSRWSKSKRRSHVANTMTYRPPECDLQPKIIRQSYDIWCLGCVYMEFVTWALGGVELWKKFGQKRLTWDVFQATKTDTFFEIVKEDNTDDVRVMVKEAVTKYFHELHSHPNCTDFLHEFLDMIQHNMLVPEPGTVYKTRRMYCEEVTEALKDMHRKCCENQDYATTKKPWTEKLLIAKPLTESVKLSMTDEAKEVIAENMSRLRPHYGPTEDHTPPGEINNAPSGDVSAACERT